MPSVKKTSLSPADGDVEGGSVNSWSEIPLVTHAVGIAEWDELVREAWSMTVLQSLQSTSAKVI